MIAIILAVSQNGVIGRDNMIPWKIPEDLRYFNKLTTGKNIVMGRTTFTSIGHALPKRENYVLTHNKSFQAKDVHVIHKTEDILAIPDDIFIIGGASLVNQVLHITDVLYLTELHTDIEGDTLINIDFSEWILKNSTSGNQKINGTFEYYFNVYVRKNK